VNRPPSGSAGSELDEAFDGGGRHVAERAADAAPRADCGDGVHCAAEKRFVAAAWFVKCPRAQRQKARKGRVEGVVGSIRRRPLEHDESAKAP
jgi:hypothetical protein